MSNDLVDRIVSSMSEVTPWRIREARCVGGLSLVELAAKSGLSLGEVRDLEIYNDEAVSVIGIRDLSRVAKVLKVTTASILGVSFLPSALLSLDQLVSTIEKFRHTSPEEFNQAAARCDLDITGVLSNPATLLECPVEAVIDICYSINNLSWIAFINWVDTLD